MGEELPFSNTVLKGKVALITGGGSRICFKIATQFGLHGPKLVIMGCWKHILEAAMVSLESRGIKVFLLCIVFPLHVVGCGHIIGMNFCSELEV
jgi:NAD(P)-dependent dehydrogenase (short-subunit alcohol dehydrogenase family)